MTRSRVLLLGLTVLVIAGCGQKGPLYLPDHNKKSNVPGSTTGNPTQPQPAQVPNAPQTPAESSTPDAPPP